ncbi:hypothetical protein PHK61_26610 [Actinomycetospora lutea]|uniref:hypothetical protein n=1 Tax=Actinomycetospora lutea TaxID=663604 RepID=UPI002366A460|nr:hypothetical protein [Actinomycetospora lutea]MDD7941993.1 hypothetical protein [Actinomycetospora lutea]
MTPPAVAFEATEPFGFFDHVRVPYRVVRASRPRPAAPVRAAGTLWPVADPGTCLWWCRAEERPASERRSGRFTVDGIPVAGRVVTDEALDRELDTAAWRRDAVVADPDGRPVSSVRRHVDGSLLLPFDPGEVLTTLWSEGYRDLGRSGLLSAVRGLAIRGYYAVRPVLPRPVQIRLRQAFTTVQGRSDFPRWPVEDCVADLSVWLLGRIGGVAGEPVPWIEPWPDGRRWALVLTHDVETGDGFAQRELLRATERDLGLRSSWNLVAERYDVDDREVRALQDEGCEIGVHGLRHDGKDLGSRRLLRRRLPAMRRAAERWGAHGFRSPATQRQWEWMPELGFAYDTSTPDTDPYEPQPGGCCTTQPFLHGDMVELPITLPQDHTVFAVLDHPGATVWLDKTAHIRDREGMALVLTHPDYATDPRVADGYRELLTTFHADPSVWHALPHEVASWWRDRAGSCLERRGGTWCVVGPAAGRARVRLGTERAVADTAP